MRTKINLVLAALLATAVAPAMAGDFYVGGSFGQSSVSIDNNALAITGQTAGSFSKNETDTAYKLFGGYELNKYLALEGGYADFGKFSARNNMTAPAVGSLGANVKASGWFVGAVGSLPLNEQFSVLGKIGSIYSTVKTDLNTSGAVTLVAGTAASRERSEFNLTYGLGMQYNISKAIAVRAEWERFEGLGNASTGGDTDLDMVSVGLSFKF